MIDSDSIDRLYEGYAEQKGWLERGQPDFETFDYIADKLRLPMYLSILEIGFGRGDFLDWAKAREYSIVGVDILPSMLKEAASRGHTVFLGPLQERPNEFSAVDMIFAFDVLEHMSAEQIIAFLQASKSWLKTAGSLFVRFPNGQSPFSRINQHGDITHKLILTVAALEQLASPVGFKVTSAGKIRPYPSGLISKIKRASAYALRDAIELILGFAYYGGPIDCDTNAHAIIMLKS